MSIKRHGLTALLVVGSMAGGALGATVISAASSSAATGSTATNSAGAPPAGGPAGGGDYGRPDNGADPGHPRDGKFVPNENALHEQGESKQRESQETAGHFPTVP